jgi:hypothetical protein
MGILAYFKTFAYQLKIWYDVFRSKTPQGKEISWVYTGIAFGIHIVYRLMYNNAIMNRKTAAVATSARARASSSSYTHLNGSRRRSRFLCMRIRHRRLRKNNNNNNKPWERNDVTTYILYYIILLYTERWTAKAYSINTRFTLNNKVVPLSLLIVIVACV